MEKKSIGGFIAALRKANGMTQKDLAERLHVSDKTISRWERDDGTPDLSVIPVIAEIFGISCDELLRGTRIPPSESSAGSEDGTLTSKGEKQRQRLLKSALSQYQTRSCIAMGISAGGIIAALICNLAFLNARLGFLLGAVFFVSSMICQAVFVTKASLCVEDAGLDTAALLDYKRKVIVLAEKSIGLTVTFVGFTLPMIMVDAYMGISAGSLLLWGALGAAAFLLIYAVVLYFLNASLLKKGVYGLSEKETAAYHHNHRLKGICAVILVILIAISLVGHHVSTAIWGPYSIAEGIVFHDYESFVAYMEQDIPAESELGPDTASVPVGPPVYYDAAGNEISEAEAMTRHLRDASGKVVCEYVSRNNSVVSMRYSPGDGTVLPITVLTQDAIRQARQTAADRHIVFAALYFLEILAVIGIYFRKKVK